MRLANAILVLLVVGGVAFGTEPAHEYNISVRNDRDRAATEHLVAWLLRQHVTAGSRVPTIVTATIPDEQLATVLDRRQVELIWAPDDKTAAMQREDRDASLLLDDRYVAIARNRDVVATAAALRREYRIQFSTAHGLRQGFAATIPSSRLGDVVRDRRIARVDRLCAAPLATCAPGQRRFSDRVVISYGLGEREPALEPDMLAKALTREYGLRDVRAEPDRLVGRATQDAIKRLRRDERVAMVVRDCRFPRPVVRGCTNNDRVPDRFVIQLARAADPDEFVRKMSERGVDVQPVMEHAFLATLDDADLASVLSNKDVVVVDHDCYAAALFKQH